VRVRCGSPVAREVLLELVEPFTPHKENHMTSLSKLTAVLTLGLGMSLAFADETVPEKVTVVKNDAVRATKKAINRVEEAVCAKSDAECLARKVKNRAREAADAVGDKVSETKNKLD
jgi:hypothetical protein